MLTMSLNMLHNPSGSIDIFLSMGQFYPYPPTLLALTIPENENELKTSTLVTQTGC